MTTVHAVLPDGVDDPRRPSGGNVYDRRVLDGLRDLGWEVREHLVPTPWPRRDDGAGLLATTLAGLPEDALTLVDGLVLSAGAEAVAGAAERLRLVVLSHMPLGFVDPALAPAEGRVLGRAAGAVVTSGWTRDWLVGRYAVPLGRVRVVRPGVDPAPEVAGSAAGTRLLCVGAVTRGKGHDLLVAALAQVADLPWQCTCVGATDLDPGFARDVQRAVRERGLGSRVELVGPRTGDGLRSAYAAADVLVLASRAETYGMVLAEALARSLPVVTADVGGVREALGDGPDLPGLLVPPEDPGALAGALREWLTDAHLRDRLRDRARDRRAALPTWRSSVRGLAAALSALRSEPPPGRIRTAR